MILSVGEILTDMIGENDTYKMHIGGAPFNVAVSVVRSGGECVFVGKVGNDIAGNFIKSESKKYGVRDKIYIDPEHNTTMAFVRVTNGERDFSFVRHQTADYRLKIEEIGDISIANIVHLGTLMLSEEIGRGFANELIEKVKSQHKLLSLDANFRDDLFPSKAERNRIMLPYLMSADILKLSMDELFDITAEREINKAVNKLSFGGMLFITDGANGSYAFVNGKKYFAKSEKVKPIDTTGAGDAYFGTVLAEIDRCIINNIEVEENIMNIIEKANCSGCKAVLHVGAV